MSATLEVETCFGVEEVVFLVDVEEVLVVEIGLLVVGKLVVIAVGLVAYVAILHIGKHAPCGCDGIGSLDVGIAVEFLRIGVVVLIVALRHEQTSQFVVREIGHVAEVVAREVLQAQPADDVPQLVFVVHIAHQSVDILFQSLLAHPVGTFHTVNGIVAELSVRQSEFLDFILGTELLVVAVAVGVVQRGGGVPVGVDVPCSGQDVVALPEVVGGLVPIRAVVHLIAFGQVVAVGVARKIAIGIIGELLVERVVAAQTYLVHVFIGLDAGVGTVDAVHDRQVVVTGGNTIPGLSSLLEVTDILIAQLEVVAHPGQSTVVRARASAGAVDVAVGVCLVVGTVQNPMVPQQSR